MNLIRNTLIFVVLIQLLGFLYVKLVQKPIESHQIIKLSRTIILPQSNDYTTYPRNTPIPKRITVAISTPKKIVKKTIKTQPIKVSVKHYVKNKNVSTLNKKVESYAKKLLGFKYVWGATGPKTFDCSGFTQRVYRKTAGIRLPRVSREQAKVGKYIKYAKLKKGDMVFFDTEKEYTKKVNHVGIYIGNNKFIHASSARKKIIITSFKRKPFYKRRFLWGRRVLKDSQKVNVAMLEKEFSHLN